MRKIDFEESELAVMAIFAEKTREDTIETLREALEELEISREDATDEEMIEIVNSLIEKLQMIEDQYFYNLDLSSYLLALEDDADED